MSTTDRPISNPINMPAIDLATLASLDRGPSLLPEDLSPDKRYVALPLGTKIEALPRDLSAPPRVEADRNLHDEASFIAYVVAERIVGRSTIYCLRNVNSGVMTFTCIIDDQHTDVPSHCSHTANFMAHRSPEVETWLANTGRQKKQGEFAMWLEDVAGDIFAQNDTRRSPSGAEMLQMAQSLEFSADLRLRSVMRNRDGGIDLQYISADDAGTEERMRIFERFAISIPIYRGAENWVIEARLRYRRQDAQVIFWYDLDRPDRAIEAAGDAMIQRIREATAPVPLYLGSPD